MDNNTRPIDTFELANAESWELVAGVCQLLVALGALADN